ncbi:hypothetical protein ACLOJK_012973 [Asimina triloba]
MAMISVDSREEEAPLRGVEKPAINHARDIHILSCAFLLVFLAYHAAQNLQSTLNTDLLVLAEGVYADGFAAGIKGTYLTSAARSHAKDSHLHEGKVIGNFNGEFWGMFASTQLVKFQIIGNLITLALLKNGKARFTLQIISKCAVVLFTDCEQLLLDLSGPFGPEHRFISIVALTVLHCFVDGAFHQTKFNHCVMASWVTFEHSSNIHYLPDTRSEFTKHIVKPTMGESGVGGAMAIYGAADAMRARELGP